MLDSKCLLDPVPPFAGGANAPPESPERAGKAKCKLVIGIVNCSFERCPEIRLLDIEPVKPDTLIGTRQLWLRSFRKLDKPLNVRALDSTELPTVGEHVDPKF